MNFWNIIYEWTSGKQEPERPGWYYVARNLHGRIDITTYEWSQYGWNTSERAHESPIEFECEFWWTPALAVDVKERT